MKLPGKAKSSSSCFLQVAAEPLRRKDIIYLHLSLFFTFANSTTTGDQ